ncbi:hypothetical protein M3Y98_00099200 [Aphelenchoides besseyi]|nr:hypothetical protein M3Y98_00099200 [Aphelenchoides besseyi]
MGSDMSLEKMWILRDKNQHTDFRLIVEGKPIMVHKNVLAQESSFFARLLAIQRLWSIRSTRSSRSSSSFLTTFIVRLSIHSMKTLIWRRTEQHSQSISRTFIRCHGLTMENVITRLDMAVGHKDRMVIHLLEEFIERNGEKKKNVEDYLAKLTI